MAKALKPEQAEQIHLLRDVVDGWGDPVHSAEWIAQQMGVSESTVWRVLKGRSAYGRGVKGARVTAASLSLLERDGLGALEQDRPDLDRAAEDSLKKFTTLMERQAAAEALTSPEVRERAKMLGAFEAPPSALDE